MKKLFSLILVLCMLAGAAAVAESDYRPAPVRTDTAIEELLCGWKCFCKGVSGIYLPVREDVGTVLTVQQPLTGGYLLVLVDPILGSIVNALNVGFANGELIHQAETTTIAVRLQEDGILQMEVTQEGAAYTLYFRKM